MNTAFAKNPKRRNVGFLLLFGLTAISLAVISCCIFLPTAISCATDNLMEKTGVVHLFEAHDSFYFVEVDGIGYEISEDLSYFVQYDQLPEVLTQGTTITFWHAPTVGNPIVALEIDGVVYFEKQATSNLVATLNFASALLYLSIGAVGLGATIKSIIALTLPKLVEVTLAEFCTEMAKGAVHPNERAEYQRNLLAPIQKLARKGLLTLVAMFSIAFLVLFYCTMSMQDVFIVKCATIGLLVVDVICLVALILWFVFKKKFLLKASRYYADKFKFEVQQQGKNVFLFGGLIYSFTFAGLTMTSYLDKNNFVTIPYDQLHLVAEPAYKEQGELASIWLFHNVDEIEEELVEEDVAENPRQAYEPAEQNAPLQKEGFVLKLNQDVFNALKRFGVRVDNLDELLSYVTNPYNIYLKTQMKKGITLKDLQKMQQ